MKFYIKTYGCQMNLRDSDSAAALLIEKGLIPVQSEQEADLIILNTCSVRDQAERKAIGKLGFLGKRKRTRPDLILGIMGCMAQSRGEELLRSIPHLDFALGTDQIHRIPDIVEQVLNQKCRQSCFDRASADTPGIDSHRFDGAESAHSAFVSVMRGCSRYCSYCIVPFVRGPERSRSKDSILEECRKLADHGIPEIFLLGQNVSAYGLDNSAPPSSPEAGSPFAELLSNIAGIAGIRRIRFTSPHPAYFTRPLMDVIAQNEKVCKYIHLPLQSGANRILKLMNRPYTAERYFSIVEYLKERVQDIAFSTDVIVGFPTETEEDFQDTRHMMNLVGYDNAYIFKYSPRKGTRSAQMEDDVPKAVKEERNRILLEELGKTVSDSNQQLIGREFEVLVEGESKRNASRWCGRTDTFRQVVFTPPETGMQPGTFLRLKITRATATTLYGEMVIDK